MTVSALNIRPASTNDAAAIAAIYAPYVRDTAISFETEPPDAATMAERIAGTLAAYPWLVAGRGGAIVGFAYAGKHRERAAYRWSVDVTIYVSSAAKRLGVGRGLYGPLFEMLRQQGFRAAFGGITLPNAGSVGLHEAMGFRHVGTYREVGFKLGAWHDVGWWRLALSDAAQPPSEPIPFAVFRETSVCAAILAH